MAPLRLRHATLVSACAPLLVAACAPASPAPRTAAVALVRTSPAPTRYAEEDDAYALTAPPDPARKAKLAALVPRIDAMLAKMVEDDHTPGLGVAIVLDGEIVYAKGFGVRDRATHAPFDADTVFRVASVTKSFVAMAILKRGRAAGTMRRRATCWRPR